MRQDFRIGIVGAGRMGANMARRLKETGFHLTGVFDIDHPVALTLAAELALDAMDQPSRVADSSSVVITAVSDDASMQDIFSEHNPHSLLAHATKRLFINCATVTPMVQVKVAQAVERHGGFCLEACMAGSITQARQGTLYLICGGTTEVFAMALPLLNALGNRVRHIGPAGEAAKVKALVNMVMNSNTAALAEGLGLGAALGVNLTLLRDVFSQTGASSRVLETDGEDMQQRTHDCYFSAAHAAKDQAIALALAKEAGLLLPIAQATLDQYSRLMASGKGALDKSAVAELTFKDRQGPLL